VTADPSAAVTADPPDPEVHWERLNFRSLAVRPAKDLVRLLPVLVGLLYAGSRNGHHDYWGLGFAVFAMVASIWRWFTTRYRITDDRVYVRRGLLNQKVLSVARASVRSVDLSAHVLYRLLGLAEVKIGTGRNDKREGENFRLDALAVTDAEALRAMLLAAPVARAVATSDAADASSAVLDVQDVQGVQNVQDVEIARLHPAWIRFAPLTLTGLVILGVLVGTILQASNEAHVNLGSVGPIHRFTHDFTALPLVQQVLEGALFVLLSLVVVSVLGYIAVFWNFRLTRQGGDTLRVTRGLLSTRATTIDMQRLRGIEISEPLLLRAAGGARCIAITTGLRVGGGAERGGSVLLPPAPRAIADAVAGEVLGVSGELSEELCAGPLVEHGRAARRRRYTRALAGAALIVVAVAVLCWVQNGSVWIWLSFLALLPLAGLLAADRYRGLGHLLSGGRLVASTGSLVRRRSILATEGIVGWQIRQSWFQRRQGLVTLTAATAAGRQRYEVHDLPTADALALALAANQDLIAPFLTPQNPLPSV
jgi:putative membrane protein